MLYFRMGRFFETVTDLRAAAETLRRRRYGVIEIRGGELKAIHLRPWPKLVSIVGAILGQRYHQRSRGDQLAECRCFFDGEQWLLVSDTELLDGFTEIEGAVGHIVSVEHRKDALADGIDMTGVTYIAVSKDGVPVHQNHNGRGIVRLNPSTKDFQSLTGIPQRLRLLQVPF